MIKVAVISATGYVGYDMVRILSSHPGFELTCVTSQSYVGKKYSDVYPNLRNVVDLECMALDPEKIADEADVFITAFPHGVSRDVIPVLLSKGKRVLDHSGEFRYRNVEVFEQAYKTKHEFPELIQKAVYGLPEIYAKDIRDAELIANPGCYPTCSILGLAPLLKSKAIDNSSIIIDAVSGVTGAGRKTSLPLHFCECTENFKAYNIINHRHTSEIEQELSLLANQEIRITFTPHLAPIKRGMLCTIYANLIEKTTTSELTQHYKDTYKNNYFVRVLDEGILPETKNVAGSNFIDISVNVDTRLNRVTVLSALDNLGKGAAAQAIQCLNIMYGYDETMGLMAPGLYL